MRSIALSLGVALGLGMAVAAPQAVLAAETTSVLEITKSASKETLKPGETMEYRIEIGCSTISDLGCRGAMLSDLIPAEFEIIPGSVSVSNATSNPPVVEGNQVTVGFTDPLGDGSVGLAENADAVVTIQVRLREDLPFEANGKPIVNTATADAENALEVSDVVSVVPEVEKKLAVEVEKAYNPASGQAEPGAKTQLTVNGTNKSNAGVDALTLTDPTDPAASPNPFDLLEIATIDSLTFPDGAKDTATVEYFIDGEWVSEVLSASAMPHAPPGDAKGVRVTFTAADGSKLPTNAGGGFVLNLEQRESVADLTEQTVVKNTVESEVALDGETTAAENTADYTMFTDDLSVKAEKSFSPNELIEGQQTEVTLTGTNSSAVDLDRFSIREPASGDFAAELDFTGFTSKAQFPFDAAGGTFTLVYLNDDGAEQTFGPVALTDKGDFPALPDNFVSLKHFKLDFTGPVQPGSSSEITFTAEANEKALNPTQSVKNVVGVEGSAGSKTAEDAADDTVSFSEKKLEIVTEKKLSPGEIWGYPGEGVLVQLPTTVVKPGSNVAANEIIVSDPALSDPADPNSAPAQSDFWENFTPQAITNTDVPDGAKLTVRYWDTDANKWLPIPGFEGLEGTVSYQELPADILEKIGGIQFVFEKPDPGFEPHEAGEFNVNPSFTATLDKKYAGEKPLELANCATSSGAAKPAGEAIAEDVTDAPACDEIIVNAPKPGEYDLFDKTWLDAGNPAQIVQRSGDHATTRLHWSTENLTFDEMTLGETRLGKTQGAGPADPVEKTTYEAFNLVKVKAVTEDKAFAKGWDMITAIDLWIGGAWVPATNATNLPYTKTMSDVVLTADEQRDATAVRVTFEENPGGRLNADAPAPGTGITKSMGRDRKVDLEWELRDVRRSNPSVAVIASEIFNIAGEEGVVKNWGSATGVQPGGGTEYDQEDEDITIVPRPLGVTVSKGWSGGPLGVPPGDVPASSYPTSRVTISATNTSQQKVDTLSIVDPGEGQQSPFEIFSLRKIVSAPHPVTGGDADKTLVILTKSDGSIIDPTGMGGATPGQAIAMTPAELADVVKIELRHEGRIATKATATLQLDLQLRKTHRSNPDKPVTVVDSPVKNETSATVTDLLGLEQEHSVSADDAAQIRLDTFEIGVQTSKGFTPDTQYVEWLPGDPEHTAEQWSPIRMDLTARPTGTARTDKLVVTDSGENRTAGTPSAKSFWNAFRFVGFSEDTLAVANPINRVQAEVLYGDFSSQVPANALDFIPAAATPNADGWVPGTAAPVAVTGGKIEAAAATLLADIPAADYDKIRGIRFTYTREDAGGTLLAFENPANPEVKIALDVKRRAYLVSDPTVAVPDSDALASAPGESAKAPGGLFNNTVDAAAESYVKLPVEGSDDPMPLVVTDEDTARVTYLAEGIEVAVEKTPLGAQQPGAVIPFKLKTTNTGARVDDPVVNESRGIPDPVIRDLFPVADGKPQLIFDPDMDEAKRFSFELHNAYADGPKEVPVDPSLIEVVYLGEDLQPLVGDGEPFGVEFRFPDGSVLYPEEAYTVTVNMMFRPGVLAGTENALTNSFYVSSDQVFNGCNFDSNHQTKECRADTEVYPTEAGALRGKKYVRANDNELGVADVPNPNAGIECVPNFGDERSGYSVGNCVPITKPLGIETWREELQNTGTLEMDKVVTIDSLPKPDDQGALVLLPRKSEWQPQWVGNIALVEDTAPDGAVYRTGVPFELFYSSSENPACIADLKPTEQQCDGFWQPLDDSVDPETVRHVKTVFDFSEQHLKPGERLAYTFETRTPASAPKMTADTVAWNSIAVGAQTLSSDGKKHASVLPTEGLRVGVALATGPLSVQKVVEGPGADNAPETFDVTVECEVPQREGSDGPVKLQDINLTIGANEVVQLEEQLPWGAECKLTEQTGVHGETSSESETVTVGRDSDPVPVATLTNTYELGSFTVAKQVQGAENQDGEAIDYGAFPVAAECSFLGKDVPLDPATVELTAGGIAWLVEKLPVGAKCTLTETDAKGGSATLTADGEALAPNDDGSWTFEITQGPNAVDLQLTNTMPEVAMEITKQIAGEGSSVVPDTTVFSFDVLCTFEGDTVYSDTVTITKGEALDGKVVRISTLPRGAECGVTETETGGATSHELVDANGEPVTGPVVIESLDQAVRFTAVNTFDAGSLHVTKEIAGEGADRWGTGPFEVSLECSFEGTPIPVPGGGERELSSESGYEAEYAGLPIGAKCGLTETVTGGATSSEIVSADGEPVTGPITVGAGDALALRVVNTFDVGSLEVTKQIAGDGASLAAEKTFTVALSCTVDRDGETVAIEVPEGAERELSQQGGLTASYEELPVGAECELRETEAGGAASVAITPNSGDVTVGTATVAADEVIELTVVNEFPLEPKVPPVDEGGEKPGGEKPALPGTGGGLPFVWLFAGGGLVLLGAVLVVLRARRATKE